MKKWLDDLLYYPKHMKQKDDNFIRLFAPSLIGVVICLACLVGMTWAWFNTSIVSGENRISAASYDLKVIVNDGSETYTRQDDGAYHVPLVANQTYTIQLIGSGNATVGYGTISGGEENDDGKTVVYYTESIKTESVTSSTEENSITFTICSGQNTQLVITPVWGKFDSQVSSEATITYKLLESNRSLYILGATPKTTQLKTKENAKTQLSDASNAAGSSETVGSAESGVASTAATSSEAVGSDSEQTSSDSVDSVVSNTLQESEGAESTATDSEPATEE